jgi:5-methyltetrahydropteroyltriglutamate--homocysteine methyltransferase
MMRNIPPFRADHVGSLLRPQELRDARAKRARGELKEEQLKAVEDRAIKGVIAKEEAVGLKGVTDGEYRREFWHIDFLAGLDGVESYAADHGIKFQGGTSNS